MKKDKITKMTLDLYGDEKLYTIYFPKNTSKGEKKTVKIICAALERAGKKTDRTRIAKLRKLHFILKQDDPEMEELPKSVRLKKK